MQPAKKVDVITRFSEIDWQNWEPTQRATLCFIIQDDRMLLIHKKRGLGKGKINGPGGRIDPGETPRQCAVREVQEELCVTPSELTHHGELHFQFSDGFGIFVHVYSATKMAGEPRETDEAVPLWVTTDAIPYERMWADDILWLPLLLENKRFVGRFLFRGDEMIDHELDVLETLTPR